MLYIGSRFAVMLAAQISALQLDRGVPNPSARTAESVRNRKMFTK
jgi:hypothetical protein